MAVIIPYQPNSGDNAGPQLRPGAGGFNPNQASPSDFGSQVGQAQQQLGNTEEGLGQDLARLDQGQALKNKLASAKEGEQVYRDGARDLQFGDGTNTNPGFLSAQGNAAVDALPAYRAGLSQLRDKVLAQYGTDPEVAAMLGPQLHALWGQDQELGLRHGMQQRLVGNEQVSKSRIDGASQDATLFYNDPSRVAQAQETIQNELTQQGMPTEAAAFRTQEIMGKSLEGAIQEKAVSDPVGANALLNQTRHLMPPALATRLEEYLHPKVIQEQAEKYVTQQVTAATGAGVVGRATGTYADNIKVESGGRQFDSTGAPLKPPEFANDPDGPVGISQIRPSTAKQVAARIGVPFDADKLAKDPNYNLKLGQALHDGLMQQYGGNKIMADAAYYDGANGVAGLIKAYGDPNSGTISNAAWVQKIAATAPKTAAYVQKVNQLGPPSQAQVQGFSQPDWSAITTKAISDAGDNMELRRAMLSQIGQQRTTIDQMTATQKQGVDRQFNDAMKAASNGDPYQISESDIRGVNPPGIAEDMIANLHAQTTGGLAFKALQFAPREQVGAVIDGMKKQMADGTVDPRTYGTQAQVVQHLTQLYDTRTAEAKQAFIDKEKDFRQNIVEGNVTQDQVRQRQEQATSLFGADKGLELGGDLQQVYEGAQAGKALAYASPDQTQQAINTLQSNPTTNTAQRAQQVQMLTERLHRRDEAVKADPAAYVSKEPGVAAALQAAVASPGDPVAAQAAAQASLNVQGRLGVAPNERRILTNDQLSQEVGILKSADPTEVDLSKLLDQQAQKYGDLWPQVMGELVTKGKISKDYQILASMTAPGQVGAKADYQRFLKQRATMGAAKWNDIGQGNNTQLEQALENNLSDVQQTFRYDSGGTFQDVVKSGIKDMAIGYMHTGEASSPAAAVQKARDAIIDQKYDIDRETRAPKGMLNSSLSYGQQIVGGLSQRDLRDNDATLAEARQGSWVANPKDDGLVLMAPNPKGGMRPVYRNDGTPLGFRFDDVPKSDNPPGFFGKLFGSVDPSVSAQPVSDWRTIPGANAPSWNPNRAEPHDAFVWNDTTGNTERGDPNHKYGGPAVNYLGTNTAKATNIPQIPEGYPAHGDYDGRGASREAITLGSFLHEREPQDSDADWEAKQHVKELLIQRGRRSST